MNHRTSTSNTATKANIRVSHQRWVHRNQLKQGMYVVELDKPWEESPFLFQGFFLDSPELVEDVQQECEYVLVQEQKSALVSRVSPNRYCGSVSRTNNAFS